MNRKCQFNINNKKQSASKYPHYVEGVVYAPLHIDSDWETMTQHDVDQLMITFSDKLDCIDIMHDQQKCGAKAVRLFKALEGDPDNYPVGAWVLGVGLDEGEVWERIKSGELNGYSAHFSSYKVPKMVTVELARIALGETEKNIDEQILPPHVHEYYIEFDNDGRVTIGTTSETLNHSHIIRGTVATESDMGHSHRFFVGD